MERESNDARFPGVEKNGDGKGRTTNQLVWCESAEVTEVIQTAPVDDDHAGLDHSVEMHYLDNISAECKHFAVSMNCEKLLEQSKERVFVYASRDTVKARATPGMGSYTGRRSRKNVCFGLYI